jgi:hypothetical protein
MPTPDQSADRLSARQHGLIVRGQALAAGLTARQIDRRLGSGRWRVAGRGVYAVAGVPVDWRQAALAACLSRPDRAVASHLTAAALHGLTRPPTTPHITVPPTAAGRSPTSIVHRAPLDRLDVVRADGIPCTSVARTLIDCAAVMGERRLGDLVDAALCARLSHRNVVMEAIARSSPGRGRKGVAALRQLIEAWSPAIVPGSVAEMRLRRQIVGWGFPPPEAQIEILAVDGTFVGRIDVGWREVRFGLEYDADETHAPPRWQRDERRHPRYESAGWDVRRIDKHDLRAGNPWLRELLASRLRPRAA